MKSGRELAPVFEKLLTGGVEEKNGGDCPVGSKLARSGLKSQHLNKGPPWWRSQRYILAYLLMLGSMNMFFQRSNFSIAIICMVNHTANSAEFFLTDEYSAAYPDKDVDFKSFPYSIFNQSGLSNITSVDVTQTGNLFIEKIQKPTAENKDMYSACSLNALGSDTEKEDGPLLWDKRTQGLLLGAMYWTFTVVTLPGSYLVRGFQKKHVVFVSMAVMTFATSLTHGAALLSPWAVFLVRIIIGSMVALYNVSSIAMWVAWAPQSERAVLISLHISGEMIGNVIVFPMSAMLCKYGFLGGWPSVFYSQALLCVLWLILFYVFTCEDPENHKLISEEEKNYIKSSLLPVKKEEVKTVPYRAMLCCPAVWGLLIVFMTYHWGMYLLHSTLPQYMFEVMKFDLKANGVYSMLPYIAFMAVMQVAGLASDIAVRRQLFGVAATRKICIIIGNIFPAILLVSLSYLNCTQPVMAVALLTASVGLSGFGLSGILVNIFDIASVYAGQLMAIAATLGTISGILAPYMVSAITVDQKREEWQIVFFITAGMLIFGTIVFSFLRRGDIQDWAKPAISENIAMEDTTSHEV